MCGTHTVETVRWLAPPPMLISYRSATSRNPSLCSCDRPPIAPNDCSSNSRCEAPPRTWSRTGTSSGRLMRTLLAPPPIATGTAPIGGGNVDLDAARPAADAQSEQFDAVELSLDVRRSASDLDLPRHRGRQRDLGAPASPFERPVEARIPEDDRLRIERRLRRVAREARTQHLVEIRHSAHHQLRRSVREREPARRCGSKCDGDIVSVVGNRQCIVRGHRLVLSCRTPFHRSNGILQQVGGYCQTVFEK